MKNILKQFNKEIFKKGLVFKYSFIFGLILFVSFSFFASQALATSVNLTYSKNPTGAGTNTITATYLQDIPSLPTVSVNQQGTTDISNAVMTNTNGGTAWTLQTTSASPAGSYAYGNNTFVMVGSNGTAYSSSDGLTWTARTAASSNNWASVTYGNGLFVAVATGLGTNRVMTSPDGITWTGRVSALETNMWWNVAFGNGTFVAIGSGAASTTTNIVMTSPDGITWTARTLPNSTNLMSLTYGNGYFVAGNNNGTVYFSSNNGVSWGTKGVGTAGNLSNIAYGNGLFVVIDTTSGYSSVSPDLVNWTTHFFMINYATTLRYGNGIFFISDGSSVSTSVDGYNWTAASLLGNNSPWYYLGFQKNNFWAFGPGGVMTAPAGSIFTYNYTVNNDTGTTYIDGVATVSLSSVTDVSGNIASAPTNNTFTIATRINPTVTTPTVTSIGTTTATLGANVTSLGIPASISARGTCWGTTPAPTTNCVAEGGTTTGVFTQNRTGFTANTLYYYRGYATNASDTGYSADGTFTSTLSVYLGDSFQGGKVAYILASGDPGYVADGNTRGLIASLSDISGTWATYGSSCATTNISWADGTAIGTGSQNTTDMFNASCNNIAQQVKNVNINGYSDWYIPSVDELKKLFINSTAIGGLAGTYWSSSEYPGYTVYAYYQTTSVSGSGMDKTNNNHVRPIRSFTISGITNTVPQVTTSWATSVTGTTASLSATVQTLGVPASISARGICWGTSPSPTSCTVGSGTTTGLYAVSATGLNPGTTYYFRGYATNTIGTGYGSDLTFTTSSNVVPTVTTPTSASITSTTVTLGANVTSLGLPAAISARGTCWATTPAPTTNCLAQGGTTTGVFTQSRTGFTANTLYYYRGYATNATGTGYSSDATFIKDTISPTVILSSDSSSTTSENISVTATFSEVTTNFILSDITVTNGTAGTFSGSGMVYTFIITPTADGIVTVKLNAGVATDSSGNENIISNTLSRTYNHSGPSVALTYTKSVVGTGVQTITATYSKPITGIPTISINQQGSISILNSSMSVGTNYNYNTPWYGTSGWGYRTKITIDHTKVPNTDQTNFPVLISRTDTNWKDTVNNGHVGQSDGGDILFTSTDGTTKLNHEIETYTASNGNLIAWVKIPVLSSTVDTDIYMYYGNASASDQWNINGVWDDNYKGIWHLSNNTALDSFNVNNGTLVGSPISIDSKIGKGINFDGVSQEITLPGPALSTNGTIEGWFYWDTSDANVASLLRDNRASGGWLLGYVPTNSFYFRTGGTQFISNTLATSYRDDFSHYVITKNGTDVSMFMNGTLVYSSSGSGDTIALLPWHVMKNGPNTDFLKGKADEIRISDISRSTDWIKTEYNNQSIPSAFYSTDSEESSVVGTVWNYNYTVNSANGTTYKDGIATVSLSSTTDALGNASSAPTNNTFTINTSGPAPVLSYSSNPASTGSLIITATYSSPVIGAPIISINQPGSTDITDVLMSGSGTTRTYIYNVNKANGGTYIDGTATVSLTSILDASGNPTNLPTNTTFIINTTSNANVALSYSSNPASVGTNTITATYSEAITGTPKISVDQPGSTDIVNATMSGSGLVWTYAYTVHPTDGTAYINGTAKVSLSGVTDTSENPLNAPTNDTFEIDTAGPTVALTYSSNPAGEGTNKITAIYSKAIIGTPTISIDQPGSVDIENEGTSYFERPIEWTERTSPVTSSYSITYGNGLFVAVGGSGNTMHSTDGINWAESIEPQGNLWASVAYGNGIFVAVAGNGDNRVMTSPDGITWTAQTSEVAAYSNWKSITYGNGIFIAVAYDGTNRIMTSSDGINWIARSTSPFESLWYSITYGNGIFVAVSDSWITTSVDGVTWTNLIEAPGGWDSVTYGNGLFVAVAAGPYYTNMVMTSPDGINWTVQPAPKGDWFAIAYGDGLFVASGSNATMISRDAINWTSITPVASEFWNAIAYGNGLFVAPSIWGKIMTFSTKNIYTSTYDYTVHTKDGTTYKDGLATVSLSTVLDADGNISSPPTNDTFVIDTNSITGLNVALSYSANVATQESLERITARYSDAITSVPKISIDQPGSTDIPDTTMNLPASSWTQSSSSEQNTWLSVAYGNNLFVAVSIEGNVMTSIDGNTWTPRDASTASLWDSVTYGNGLFVAVAQNGNVMKSSNGINWTTSIPSSYFEWNSVTYGEGLFVAVSSNGTNRVMTSPDGITWAERTTPEENTWTSVVYGNETFVAVAYDGTNRVMTSSDGITWTIGTSIPTGSWKSVAYGNNVFVAVSNDGQVATSSNGTTWTSQTHPEANNWKSITYGNGLFVAVSVDGNHRVMTSPDGITWTSRTAAEANIWQSVTYGNGTFVAVSIDGTHQVMSSSDGYFYDYTVHVANGVEYIDGTAIVALSTVKDGDGNDSNSPTNNTFRIKTSPNFAASGILTSSIFDTTPDSSNIKYNSIMWKGELGGESKNEGKVSFQLATSASPEGPWTTFVGGDTCQVGDWFDTTGPDSPVELKGAYCIANWEGKEYFKYKVRICSNSDCSTQGPNTPTVSSVIVNWSP